MELVSIVMVLFWWIIGAAAGTYLSVASIIFLTLSSGLPSLATRKVGKMKVEVTPLSEDAVMLTDVSAIFFVLSMWITTAFSSGFVGRLFSNTSLFR